MTWTRTTTIAGLKDMTQERSARDEGQRFGWMDGRTRGYTFLPNPQAESVFKACSAFAFELN